ncbi:MAG: hypothetical protein KTR31_13755 [Myxococcales bacterium]|nr:hypothetical protein [Myxococcales bacterium]
MLRSAASTVAPYVVWGVALFVVLAWWVQVRLEVNQLRQDLHRNSAAHREAALFNERLKLEMDARRRTVAMERAATRMGLSPKAAPTVRVQGVR